MSRRDLLVSVASVAARGLLLKVTAITAALALVGILALAVVATLADGGGQQSDACDDDGLVAAPVAVVDVDQQSIARTADEVATEMNMPGRAVLIILMTGLQESGMRNLTYGDRDSLGWLQQRPSQGWGSADQVMDVAHSSRSFYRALRAVTGWTTLSLNDAAQAVQRSGHPDAYAKHEAAARGLAADVGADLTRPGDPYGTGDLLTVGEAAWSCGADLVASGPLPDGTWPPESATICPDPTNGRGCITARTAALVAAIRSAGIGYRSISCWDPHAWNPASDHSRGRACDLAYSSGYATGQALAEGTRAANWAVANAGTLGVKYVIWQAQIWTSATGTWRTYTSGIYDVTSPSGGHYDHVHISMH